MSDSAVITRPETREETKTRQIPPYNVVLLNDEHHSMEFVVMVLVKVFGYALEKCFQLMLNAHETGRSIIWTGPREVAELKVEQMSTFHETRGKKDLGALGCEIEPAPG